MLQDHTLLIGIIIIMTSLSIMLLPIYRYIESKKNLERIQNFDAYVTVLQYHLTKAYDIIYKDRILIYSLEATRLDDTELEQVTKDFIILVLQLLGPTLEENLAELYGDEGTLYFNITEYFSSRVDDDEIRQASQDTLMNSEIDGDQQ
ncbi:hypothetical protein KAR91_80215 [Candidatus Pacearchaeota archaeon]|nr:hypothetical protein [Candidatus Pacearchaeota archaeon]